MATEPFGLEGRRALVTAAGRGIGRGIAIALAAAGARVAVNSYRRETAEDTVSAIREAGGEAFALPGDATDPDAIDAMLAAAIDELGGLDVLVNNVGAGPVDGIPGGDTPSRRTAALWDALYGQNLRAAVVATEAAMPALVASGRGRVVNISSIAGHTAFSPTALRTLVPPAYGAAKAALSHYTRSAAELFGADGVTVNAVCPGIVWTDAWRANAEQIVDDAAKARDWFEGIARGAYPELFDRTPTRREQTVEEVAAAVVYLCSDAARSVTGQALMVDGGMVHAH